MKANESFSEMLSSRLVRRVVHRARKMGMSRLDLCDSAEISPSHLSNLLAGRFRLTVDIADKLMQAVDLTMQEYWSGEDRAEYRGVFLPREYEKKIRHAVRQVRRIERQENAIPGPVFGRLV